MGFMPVYPPGLSPRVRGNLATPTFPLQHHRSIPAGAGEPSHDALYSFLHRVYPRGCGGTSVRSGPIDRTDGLFPRVRGDPSTHPRLSRRRRSIPAGAGEPFVTTFASSGEPVYPRGCGGTSVPLATKRTKCGLSPRVWGNLFASTQKMGRVGSIPAGAGEPRGKLPHLRERQVYPRGCGGTRHRSDVAVYHPGLSPRVRGNQLQPHGTRIRRRSIPAGAGEPHAVEYVLHHQGVYPRGCGGT